MRLNPISWLIITHGFLFLGCSPTKFGVSKQAQKQDLSETAGIIINNGADYTSKTKVELTIFNTLAKEMYVTSDPKCKNGGVWESLSVKKDWVLENLNQTSYVYVKFRYDATSSESFCLSDAIIHDDIPPVVVITQAAPAVSNLDRIRIQFQIQDAGSGPSHATCASDENPSTPIACAGTYTNSANSDGINYVDITATDLAGNTSAPKRERWLIDKIPPTVQLHLVPPSLTGATQAQFIYSGTDVGTEVVSYQCRLDSQTVVDCDGDTNMMNLAAGLRQFSVVAVDAAGNHSQPATYQWTIDLDAPSVQILSHPDPVTALTSATFSFTGQDDQQEVRRFLCQVDNQTPAPCESPLTKQSLFEGTHVFSVTAVDGVGNISAPAKYNWIIDLTPPVIAWVNRPEVLTNSSTAEFTYEATDALSGVAKVLCQVDQMPVNECHRNIFKLNQLTEGRHELTVKAVDLAGNESLSIKYAWTVDTKPPTLRLISGPRNFDNNHSPQFQFLALDDQVGTVSYFCQKDGGSREPCASAWSWNDVTEGAHTLTVIAKDVAGNSSLSLQVSWVADFTPPVITWVNPPKATLGLFTPITLNYNVTDNLSPLERSQCQLAQVILTNQCTLTLKQAQIPAQEQGEHQVTVSVWDQAGNLSENTFTWTVTPTLVFPDINQYATMVFEDLYPRLGDADFNDFIVDFKIVEFINSQLQLEKIVMDFTPVARGADYIHQFYIVLDGKKDFKSHMPEKIGSTVLPAFNGEARIALSRLDLNGQVISTVSGIDKSRDLAIFERTDDIFPKIPNVPSGNTDGVHFSPPRYKARLEIELLSPQLNGLQGRKTIDMNRYRMLLKVIKTGEDIDVIDINPLAIDSKGYPYGFIVPKTWSYPLEGKKISSIYDKFESYKDWLLRKKQNPQIADPTQQILHWYEYPKANTEHLRVNRTDH